MSTSAVAELLGSLRQACDRLGVRWYLFGAQAVLAYGRPRFTEDVDVTVELGERATSDLVRALEREGFELPEFADDEFIAVTRVVPMVHSATKLSLDIVLAGPGLEALFLDGSAPLEFAGIDVPIISPEHLVVTKILSGRAKDLDDVAGILAEQDDLDLDPIRALLRELESALGQSDLLPAFEKLVAER